MGFTFQIRDGLETDIAACLNLDTNYETEYVWQMSIQRGTNQHGVIFKQERLPRPIEVEYTMTAARLHSVLPPEQCFLVAVGKAEGEVIGYLTMRPDPNYRIAWIQDMVVDRPFRRQRIATRLFNIAMRWALEHNLTTLTVETQTKNYPALMFCQKIGLAFCGYNDHYFPNQDIAVFFSRTLR